LILFLTFVVILATLVVQGLSLPPLIRWLGVEDDGSMEKEERDARLKANQAALARLKQLAESDPARADLRYACFHPNTSGSRTRRSNRNARPSCSFATKM
jgi:CPA1 family monovalent cation:H+ antiporter